MAVATSMRRPTARAVGSVAVATVVANVCSYLVHLPAGRWLAPSGYGEFAVLLQVILLLSVPAVAVQSVIAREVVRGRDLAAVLRAATWTTLGVAAVSACAVPIVAAVYRLLHGAPARDIVAELLARPLGAETDA